DQTVVPTTADYSIAGVDDVTDENLDRINAAIALLNTGDVDTAVKIQVIVNQVNADITTENAITKIDTYADDQTNTPTTADYATAGVDDVTDENLDRVNAAIAELATGDVDTTVKIQAIVNQVNADIATENAISKIDTYADDQTVVPTTTDYATAGVDDVTDENLDRVNAAIAELATGDVDTAVKIQVIVDQVNADIATENAITKIDAYADYQTIVPTTTDYLTAGIDDVTDENLDRVNAAIALLNSGDVDTAVKIQVIVDQVNTDIATENAIGKIDTYADDQTNTPTTADYSTAGVDDVTNENLDRVNAAIALLNTGDVDTAVKIQAIVNQVNTDIATENAISKIDTYADDQTVVPTTTDYATAGVDDVTNENIDRINAAIAELATGDADTAVKIQVIVDQVNADIATENAISKIDTYADDQTNTPTTTDYATAGVDDVTDENLDRVNAAIAQLATGDVDTAVKIQAIVDQINTDIATDNAFNIIEDYAASNGTSNSPDEQDFIDVGVENAATNMEDVNQAIAALDSSDVNTTLEIQALVDAINANELDTDGDKIPDVIDTDDDNDGLLDTEETDIGGLNPDQDGDGICDGDLAVTNTCTAGPDENPTNPDSDGNGICDGVIAFPASDSFKGCMANVNSDPGADSDNDGIEDSAELDSDSDGDLIPDYLDPDDAGPAPTYGDSDNDGINDQEECGSSLPCRDTDKDGIYDYLDSDSDNDGLTDDQEADGVAGNGTNGTNTPRDTDSDGLPDYIDTDSDNDGKLDEDENSPVGKDTDSDGIPDVVDHDDSGDQSGGGDSDNDGISDEQECSTYPNCPDSDNDGKPDYLDNNNDSDDDGISDAEEDPNFDKDNDPATNPRDTDNDGIPDYLDDDSDNDGKKDSDERDEPYDANNPRDTDGDGIPDVIDADDGTVGSDNEGNGAGDSDNDGIPDDVECGSQPCRDTDGDGIPDYTDTDADNDGVLDEDEIGADPQNPKDTDGDGIPDIADPVNGGEGENGGDSDGDGVADADECNSWPNCSDSDNDGIADYLDEDSSPAVVTPNPETTSEQDLGKIKTGVHGAGSLHWGFALIVSLLVMFRRKSAVFIALSMMLTSLSASAEWWDEMDLYAGAGIGQSYLDPNLGGSGYSIDDHTENAWKLTAGWDWNDHISVEGYYSDLGNVTLNPGAKIGYRMMGGDAMLHYWVYGEERMEGSVALYAKGGLNHMTNNGNNVSYEKNNTLQLFGGVGAEVYLPRKFSVRFEIESYDTDAALLSLNLVKRFGFKSKKVAQKEFVAMVETLPETASGPKIVMLAPVVLDSDLDGLLDDDDQCPYTPKGMRVNNVGCATFIGEVSDLIANVQFETNSSSLTEPSKMALNEIADMLVSYTAIDIEVQAHSDNTGSAAYNKILSQKRAESVVKYLSAKSIVQTRLKPLGFGEENPIADNNTVMGRAINRRVEFKLKQR
ncbi:MAG: outer membrane protein OmpA-like peptidoglycan-associated protein, partial [Oleispira sp.]